MSTKTAEQPKHKYESAEHERKDKELCGRFAKGNPGGPGNPHARETSMLRKAFIADATPEKAKALATKIYDMAMDGNLTAAKLYLSYTIGTPTPAADPDRVALHEVQVARETASLKDEVAALGAAGTPERLLEFLRILRPIVGAIQGQKLFDDWRELLAGGEERKKREAEEEAEAERLLNSPGPVLPDGLEEKLWPSPNGSNGELPSVIDGYGSRPPLANGSNGKAKHKKKKKGPAAPSPNGRFHI